MGALYDQIQAIIADGALTPQEKRAQFVAIRREAYRAGIVNLLPYTHSFNKNGHAWAITAHSVTLIPGGIEAVLSITRDGQPWPFSNPWRLINPPLLVSDAAGEVEISRANPVDNTVEVRRYREAPLLALRQLIERLV